jgi:uncharacterized protein (TIGR00266 family)
MEHEIRYSPSFSLLEFRLNPGELVTAEAGAMVYFSDGIQVKTRTRSGGLLQKMKVSMLGGESFFVNDYFADRPAKVGFSAPPLGDIQLLPVSPTSGYVVQSGSYVASTMGVQLDTQFQGLLKGAFGTSLFMLKAAGTGDLFLNSFGARDKHTIGPGEKLTVDNFHLVAFTEGCQYSVHKFGGLKSTLFGGEGLVTEIVGPGDVYLQTKNISEFVSWLVPYLPKEEEREEKKTVGMQMGGFKLGR